MNRSISTDRIKTLDVVRGLTMTLVVFHHVRGVTFGLYGSPSVVSELFVALRMPMFFFISGFVASKAIDVWTGSYTVSRLLTKARVELVPTIVFFTLFVTLTSWSWFFPGGYWFTLALFAMLGTYYLVSALSRRYFPHMRTILLVTAGMTLYILGPVSHLIYSDTSAEIRWFPVDNVSKFFIYFVCGTVCGGNKPKFLGMLERNMCMTFAVLLAAISLSLAHFSKELEIDGYVKAILSLAGSSSIVLVVLSAFWRNREYWNANGRLSRIMQFVGRRTLDIYMIHWFLLPGIPELKSLFWHRNNDILELVIIGAMSVAVVAGCLAVSALIRTSPFLCEWLLGGSRKRSRALTEMPYASSAPKIAIERIGKPAKVVGVEQMAGKAEILSVDSHRETR